MLEYLEGTLPPTGVAELNSLLRTNPALCREAAELLVQDLQLCEIGQEQADAVREQAVEQFRVRHLSKPSLWSILKAYWRHAVAASVATAALLWLTSTLFVIPPHPILSKIEGSVAVERAGIMSEGKLGFRLQPGDTVILQSNAWVLVAYPEEPTWFWLSDGARLQLASSRQGKVLSLAAGSVSAKVARQPPHAPLRVLTANAEVTVVGTELTVAALPETTRLEVWEGQVRLRRPRDGATVNVSSGEFVQVQDTAALTKNTFRHGVLREYWLVSHLLAADLPPNGRPTPEPDGLEYLANFQAPTDWGEDFVARMRTWVRPPRSGLYQFWIAGDDGAELWLSSDDKPENKKRICHTAEWGLANDWDRSERQRSELIALEAGRKYYMEAIQHEGAGADCMAVAWLPPNQQREILRGEFLIPPQVSPHRKEVRLQ